MDEETQKKETPGQENLEVESPDVPAEEIEALEVEPLDVPEESSHKEVLNQAAEVLDANDGPKLQAQQSAQTLNPLEEGEKLKELVKIAQKKGVVQAVLTAKKMNDPYLLDLLHDTLAKEGFYKNFIK